MTARVAVLGNGKLGVVLSRSTTASYGHFSGVRKRLGTATLAVISSHPKVILSKIFISKLENYRRLCLLYAHPNAGRPAKITRRSLSCDTRERAS